MHIDQNSIKRRHVLSLASACAATIACPALAQNFPNKTITLVVPFPPGGTIDAAARALANQLSSLLGQSVVVDNRAGVRGSNGTSFVTRAPADGHIVLFSNLTPLAITPHMTTDGNVINALAPIGTLAYGPQMLVSSKLNSVSDLRSMKPSLGHAGNGSLSHVLASLLSRSLGMRLDYKPYRGLAPLLNDMMGEQVGAAIVPVGAIVGLREPNSIKPLAITAPHKAMPGLPTFEQAGIGEATFNDWLGVLAPASTPASIVSRLNLAVNRIVQMNEIQDRLTSLGLMPQLSSPEQFGTLIKLYSNRMATVIRQEGIQIS